jgi:hypothetical protein
MQRLSSFGGINKLALTPNKQTLIAVTDNGVILNYSIFPIKKEVKED